jgi:hypothetical protein
MKINIIVGLMVAALLILLCMTPSTEARRQEATIKASKPVAMNMMPKGGMVGRGQMAGRGQSQMMGRCKMMMQMHQNMDTTTKAQDTKLKDLMSTVDRTFGDQKTIALAAVVKELVAQRTGRQEMMDKMQPQMMGHMMEHMQGMQSGDKKMMQKNQTAMMQCPMMQMSGMKDMKGMN